MQRGNEEKCGQSGDERRMRFVLLSKDLVRHVDWPISFLPAAGAVICVLVRCCGMNRRNTTCRRAPQRAAIRVRLTSIQSAISMAIGGIVDVAGGAAAAGSSGYGSVHMAPGGSASRSVSGSAEHSGCIEQV
jgi:hypothetical protein